MGKFIGIQRIHRAILNLLLWHSKVDSQGGMHLWSFLSMKRKNMTSAHMTRFGEQDDREFFDNFMRVQNADKPYYDPLIGQLRIGTHPHSNVSTLRKKTFADKWKAAKFETKQEAENGAKKNIEYGQLASNYLDIVKARVITKGGAATKIPLFDLLAWLYRTYEFPDSITLDELIQRFRADFHITDKELSSLFTREAMDGTLDTTSKFFVDHPASRELILTAAMQKESFDLSDALSSIHEDRKVQPVELDDILTLARYGRGQLIIQGPPGTGKTFVARQVAALLLGANKQLVEDINQLSTFMKQRQFSMFQGNGDIQASIEQNGGSWDIVQFHPSYNYDDFVRGITSTISSEKGVPTFQVENRVFGLMAKFSTQTKKPLVLIIDEINRGDLSKVLGELVYALEYRGEGVRTPYVADGSAIITVGRNFYILATMNTADRSIALIDYAIRRRFDFVELKPEESILMEYLLKKGLSSYVERVVELFHAISALFDTNPDFAVGHTYFMGDTPEDIARRIVFQVLPLLTEYQKEGILGEDTSIHLPEWPGASGLPLNHPRPFALAAELKSWLDAGEQDDTIVSNGER